MNRIETDYINTPHASRGSCSPNPEAQLGRLDPLVLSIIRDNNPAALPSVCTRFSALSQEEAFALKVFNGFSAHLQQQIRGAGPLPSASELQVRAYPKLRLELEQLGLDPTVIGFDREDLASYRRADRLIEAKNFCLLCSRIPGMQVDGQKLNNTADIFELRDSCLQQFNQLTIAAINALNLADLHLTRLPIEIGQLTSLQALKLSNNHLITLPDAIGSLTLLRALRLQNNQLTALPNSIGQLANLQKLRVQNNKLTEFPATIFNLAALRRNTGLLYDNNPLTPLQRVALYYYFHADEDVLSMHGALALVAILIGGLILNSATIFGSSG